MFDSCFVGDLFLFVNVSRCLWELVDILLLRSCSMMVLMRLCGLFGKVFGLIFFDV